MKKFNFLLLTIGFLLISSCSSDKSDPTPDNPAPTNIVTSKINGVDVTFDKVTVVKETYTDYVDLIVTATNTADATKKMVFNIEQNTLEAGACYFWTYTNDNLDYEWNSTAGATFTVMPTTNTTSVLKGTFSGVLTVSGVSQSVTITNGSFSVTY